jgi:hypothetical protein
MSAEQIFSLCNAAAPPAWLLMVVAPRWVITRRLILSGIYPLLLGLIYLLLIVVYFGDADGNFGSLQGVAQLFQNPFALTAGWIHYLAFDMFIGAWEVTDSQKHGVSHFLVIPCLFLTFMFGPIGLILYFIVRSVKTKKIIHEA